MLLAAVGAASEREPLTAAALEARASAKAATDLVQAEAHAEATLTLPAEPAPSHPAPELPSRPAPSQGTNETSESNESVEGNQTPPDEEAPVEPTPDPAADAPATMEPRNQSLRGQAGAPIRFVLLLTNEASTPQNVSLAAKAPVGWEVELSPSSVLLGPDETVPIHGTILTPRMVGTSGTVGVFARGSGGDDVAYVDLCTVGELQEGCRAGRENRRTQSEPQPVANESADEAAPAEGEPASEPASEPEPASNGTTQEEPAPASSGSSAPPAASDGNGTHEEGSNSTGSASTGSGSADASGAGGSAGAEASVTVGASRDDSESPPPVTLDV